MKKYIKLLIKKIKLNLIPKTRINFDFLSKNKIVLPSINLNKRPKSSKSNIRHQIIKAKEYFKQQIKQYSLNKRKSITSKSDQDITIIYYLEHVLTLISIKKGIGFNTIKGTVEIPIPGFLIGEDHIENPKELAQIILDMLNILTSQSNPILLILPSTLFTTISLKASANKSRPSDFKIKSKTPFLPSETLTDITNFDYRENSFHRVVFAKKKIIDSWIDSLQIINLPIISLTFPILHFYDEIKNVYKQKNITLLDIESNSIQVIITDSHHKIKSFKLPYGTSLYCNGSKDESISQFFERLKMSINMIETQNNYEKSKSIFVFGQGLDSLIYDSNIEIPSPFYKASDIEQIKYNEIDKSNIKDTNIINKSIDSKIFISNLILNNID